jgi:uncharacterized membrane protein YccF (DUF307 family)
MNEADPPIPIPSPPPEGPSPPSPPPGPVAVPTGPSVVVVRDPGPSMVLRAAWFLLVGWWLSGFAVSLAYFLCITIIGIPLGFAIFNRLPVIITLRPRTARETTEVINGVTYITGQTVEQLPLWLRAVYFLLVGWWAGAIYLAIAWFLCVLIVTLPIGLWLFNRVGAVMTLLRY